MKRKTIYAIISMAVVILLFSMNSCLDEDRMDRAERKMIEMYLKTLGDTIYEQKESGLVFIELVAGTGESPVTSDTVDLKGRGMYLDYGSISGDVPQAETYILGSGEKIIGIDEGLRYMKTGGTYRILTPSYLAYGISPLLWEIQIFGIRPGPR